MSREYCVPDTYRIADLPISERRPLSANELALHHARTCRWNNAGTERPTALCVVCAETAIRTALGIAALIAEQEGADWAANCIRARCSHEG